jgi:GTPase
VSRQVVVLNHPKGGISVNYEPVVHAHTLRQSAKIVSLSKASVVTGDTAICRFRFLYHPEYVSEGMTILFREGRTIGMGRITAVFASAVVA